MGIVGKVLGWVRVTRNGAKLSEVKSALSGSNHNRTVPHFSAPNEDSVPLDGDFEFLVPQRGSGRYAVLGYADVKNAKKSDRGEKRLFARNAAGDEVVELWLKKDGSATLSNSQVSVTINGDKVNVKAVGDVTLEGANINLKAPGGNILLECSRVDVKSG